MKVCIAEKPSVAREIATILGANQRHDGYFEGNGYQITWTFGHLCTLNTPDDYKPHWKRWDLNTLPMLPDKFETKLVGNTGVQKQFNTIKKLFDKADVVINCGDAGQEGELIQRWVIKQANYTGKVERLWISSLTSEAIKEGFNNLKDAADYDNLYYAGSSRAIGDWLLGMNATRLYTLRYGAAKQVLSVGRVQTPTLAMLVNRHKEIANFKPQPYWELQTVYRDTVFNNEQGRFLKKEDGESTLNKVKGQPFEIVSVSKKKGKEYAPKLFDLTGLQVYCNTKFGYTADQTLKIVQKLYEQKLVTYPRVDTTFLPDDLFPKVPGILAKLTDYADLTQALRGGKLKKTKRVFDNKKVTDHHAIIPTGEQGYMAEYDKNVYDIITRRFIAVFYPECIVSNTAVIGEVAEISFKATGKEILEEGWRAVFAKAKSTKKDTAAEKLMPTFVKGENGPHEPSFLEKETKPPKNYTEATLLRAMETAGKQINDDELRDLMKANGIGRPSTRANIIETLFRRKYVERSKKLILPTDMGIRLIDTIQNKLLKSATLTGQWEKQLKEIEEGNYSASQFIRNMKKMVDDLVVEVRMEKNIRRFGYEEKVEKPVAAKKKPTGLETATCPKCNKGNLLKGSSAYGCSSYKEGCNFRLPFEFMGKKISVSQFKRLLTKKATVVLKGFKEGKEKLNGIVVFDADFQLKLNPEKPTTTKSTSDEMTCPKCKKGKIMKGSTAYGCSAYKEGCDFRFPFDLIREKASGQTLTKELVTKILQNG
ncbi:type IA DNA topoisomerase [Flavicella sediminum]|uniref:type IA DNA topoisomerase n=1 Tax=Flavicella sediminum TaxID=2585141 RepID=UPI00111D044F|nr:type IA DNA topoisomerase [Flavicella sediminum]